MKQFACMKLMIFFAGFMIPVNGEYYATLNNVTMLVGDNATFTCDHTFADDVPVVVMWSIIIDKNSFQIMKVKPNEEDLVYQNTLASDRDIKSGLPNELLITGLKLTDNDIFSQIQCRVEYEKNSTPATTASLVVMKWPKGSGAQLEEDAFAVGERIFVGNCKSGKGYPEPKITFLKNKEPIENIVVDDPELTGFTENTADTAGSAKLEKDVTAQLFMDITEDLDKSVIQCQIFTGNEQLNDTKIKDMGVMRVKHDVSKVEIVGDNPDFVYTNGDSATFTCSHNGFPDSQIIGFGIEEDVEELESVKEISLKMTPEMNGEKLVCKAKTATQKSALATEKVLKVNYVYNVKIAGKNTYQLGEKVSLTCESAANPAVNSYTWKKDGVKLDDETSSSLIFNAKELSHAGKYSCEASNDFAMAGAEHEIVIIGITQMGEKSVKAEIKNSDKEGSNLVCKVQSSSEPTFAWYLVKEGKNQDVDAAFSKSDIAKEGLSYSQTLTAAPLDTTYSKAEFVCIATLEEKTAEMTFSLPEVKTPPENNQEIKGSSSVAGIVIGILVAILIIAIIIAVLYNKGIICRKEGKAGEVHADDIEVDIHNTDVEAGAPPPEEDKLLENGAGN